MPVRSLNSSVLRWPDKQAVLKQAEAWALKTGASDGSILSIQCFGSVLSDRWGVGSDIDLLIILESSSKTFMERTLDYDASEIDVPAEILVYTMDEWLSLEREWSRFAAEIREHSRELYAKASMR